MLPRGDSIDASEADEIRVANSYGKKDTTPFKGGIEGIIKVV